MLGFGFNKDKIRVSAERSVQQGKFQNAVSEYEKILKHDPKDLTVLNTIGDLYSRIGNTDQAISCFKQLGETYAAEGFTPKAIAMYKKLTKLSPTSLECIQKLGELYSQQGLYNDARAQFLHAAEGYIRNGDFKPASRLLARLLELDPENERVQLKLAELYLSQGNTSEAKKVFMASAESIATRSGVEASDELFARVLKLDPQNGRALAVRAEVALKKNKIDAAAEYLSAIVDIDSRPDALRLMLKCQLQRERLEEAEPIARKLLTVHNDTQGVFDCCECRSSADPGRALSLYEEFADRLAAADSAAFAQHLRQVVSRVKDNIGSLERVLKLYERISDKSQNAEIYELIAHASVKSGDLKRAGEIYKRLATLEPENPLHAQTYRQVMMKLGADPTLLEAPVSQTEQPFALNAINPEEPIVDLKAAEPKPAALPPPIDSFVASSVKEFDFEQVFDAATQEHGLGAEAVAAVDGKTFEIPVSPVPAPVQSIAPAAPSDSLIAALTPIFSVETSPAPPIVPITPVTTQAAPQVQQTPDLPAFIEPTAPSTQIIVEPSPEVLKTEESAEIDLTAEWEVAAATQELDISEASRTDFPELANEQQSVSDLIEEVRFYLSQSMFEDAKNAVHTLGLIAPDTPEIATLQKQIAKALGQDTAIIEESDSVAEPIDIPEETVESVQIEETAQETAHQPLALNDSPLVPDEPALELNDSLLELDDSSLVLEEPPLYLKENALTVERPVAQADAPVVMPEAPQPVIEQAGQLEVLPVQEPAPTDLKANIEEVIPREPISEEVAQETISLSTESASAHKAIADTLDDFVLDLDEALGNEFPLKTETTKTLAEIFATAPVPPAVAIETPTVPHTAVNEPVASMSAAIESVASAPEAEILPASQGSESNPLPVAAEAPTISVAPEVAQAESQLDSSTEANLFGDILQEFKDDLDEHVDEDEDPETHYNLGVAFKEMGLLDEAIGELQKVCQLMDKGCPFSQGMQAYTWLANCFIEKGVPEASFRWFQKALENCTNEDSRIAIHYELASAYEMAGQKDEALKNFLEVYTSNIDFRDIGERIRALRS